MWAVPPPVSASAPGRPYGYFYPVMAQQPAVQPTMAMAPSAASVAHNHALAHARSFQHIFAMPNMNMNINMNMNMNMPMQAHAQQQQQQQTQHPHTHQSHAHAHAHAQPHVPTPSHVLPADAKPIAPSPSQAHALAQAHAAAAAAAHAHAHAHGIPHTHPVTFPSTAASIRSGVPISPLLCRPVAAVAIEPLKAPPAPNNKELMKPIKKIVELPSVSIESDGLPSPSASSSSFPSLPVHSHAASSPHAAGANDESNKRKREANNLSADSVAPVVKREKPSDAVLALSLVDGRPAKSARKRAPHVFLKPVLLQNPNKAPVRVYQLIMPVSLRSHDGEGAYEPFTPEGVDGLHVALTLRIMASKADDGSVALFMVATDICRAINIRKSNAAKTVALFSPDEKAAMSILCWTNKGTTSMHVLTVLSEAGLKRLLSQSCSPLATPLLRWLLVEYAAIKASPQSALVDDANSRLIQRGQVPRPSDCVRLEFLLNSAHHDDAIRFVKAPVHQQIIQS